ncbi:MAG: DUF3793 family protein [Ruminococcus sp.]|nr:DUF3793 family protein [Ruminococcus sp.]
MLIDTVIARSAPSLAGLKTANMFGYVCADKDQLIGEIRVINRTLVPRRARLILLSFDGRRALLYLYRPSFLRRDLAHPLAQEILSQLGYPTDNPARCLMELQRRVNESEEFPHEVGLFLGYPAVDVYGFIANKAQCAKCVGTWKVYGDAEEAEKRFRMYKKCTRCYQCSYARFASFEKLVVAVS